MKTQSYKGVRYFEGADLVKGHMLEKAVEVYKDLEASHTVNSINEAIELYNINKYVQDGIFFRYVGEDKEDWVKEKNKIANSALGRYISLSIDILAEYHVVDFGYKESYWEIIADRKLNDISESRFQSFVDGQDTLLRQIFTQYKLVKKFDGIMRTHLLENPIQSTQLILDKYLLKQLVEREKPNLPQSLSLEDKELIISEYLDSEEPNLNYTRLLSHVQNTAEFSLDTRIKLKAKRISIKLEEELFTTGNQMGIAFEVAFIEDAEEIVSQEFTMQKVGTVIDVNWLKSNMDFPTLLNNFIYLFEFVDERMISVFPYNEVSSGVMERFGFSHEKEYKTGIAFSMRETLSVYQTHAYYSFLKNNEKDLESIIEWFFNEYLHLEFDIVGFNIKLPPKDNPNFEKCKSIFPTIESIVKKYRFYLEDGYIDEELVQMESKPFPFYHCPSKTQNRYVYLHNDNEEARIVKHILFSDQSDLTYFPNRGENKYDTLIEWLDLDKLYKEDIEEYQEHSLDWMLEHGYLKIQEDNHIVIDDRNKVHLYYLIHMTGVIVPNKLSKELRDEVDRLVIEGVLVSENTLLTRQEADYIDYYLNKSNFINGNDLRNKYLHGTSSSYDKENEHYTNYLHALRLLMIIVIKINDDLCIADENLSRHVE